MDVMDIYHDGRHYDRMFGALAEGDDLAFYLRLARQCTGDVLELGCGTGRLTIPLALRGLNITGLDLSHAMLACGRAKAEDAGTQVAWVQADCRSFDLRRIFALIFFPANAFQSLLDRDSQEACLSCVRRHLLLTGCFALEVYNPSLALLMRSPGECFPIGQYRNPDTGGMVTVTESVAYDAATQVNHATWYYRSGHEDEPRMAKLALRVIFPQELDALLHHNGFTIEAKYGDFAGSAFCSSSRRQIVVCRIRR